MEPSPQEVTLRLLMGARAGGEEQFTALYEHVAPAIHAWARYRIQSSARRRIEPEDIVQEVWFRAWHGLDRYDPEQATFRSWLFGIAKNVLLESYRLAERNPAVAGEESGFASRLQGLSQYPEAATSVSRKVMRSEAIEVFLEQMARLDAQDQRLVVHCGLEGLNSTAAASRLGMSQAAVQKRWMRLRVRLEQMPQLRKLFAPE